MSISVEQPRRRSKVGLLLTYLTVTAGTALVVALVVAAAAAGVVPTQAVAQGREGRRPHAQAVQAVQAAHHDLRARPWHPTPDPTPDPVPAPGPARHPAAATVEVSRALPADLPPVVQEPPPVGVGIDRLGIDAPVVAIGVAGRRREVQVPPGGRQVGWYRFGPVPGAARGVAVLTAHVDTALAGPGVFFDLADLQPGDPVAVRDDAGGVHRYVVVGREQVGKADLPVDALFRSEGPHALALVTCGGAFDPVRRRYADNVIVWAEPV